MKKNYLLVLVLLLMANGASAQNYVWEWAKSASSGHSSEAVTTTTDASGNIYTGGSFQSTSITFGTTVLTNTADNYQMFIVKHNSNGDLVWTVGGTPANYTQVTSLATDATGNLYVTGRFHTSITFGSATLNAPGFSSFLAKFNPEGVAQWAVKPGGTASTIFSNVIWKDNNVYVCGSFEGTPLTIGPSSLTNLGSGDAFAAKFDANGNGLWARRIAGTGFDSASGIAVNSWGEVLVTGSYSSATINSGSTPVSNNGNSDIFVTKLNSNGVSQWIKSYGGTGYDSGYSLLVNSQNEIYLLGRLFSPTVAIGNVQVTSANGTEILLAKIGDNGNTVWANLSGGNQGDNATDFKLDADGNVYITGFTYSSSFETGGLTLTPSGLSNMFVIKMIPAGTSEWATMVPGNDGTEARAIAVDSDEIYIAGRFNNTLSLGNTTLSNINNTGMFVAKLVPEAMGTKEVRSLHISVYPNPVKEVLNISSEISVDSKYYISDTTGRKISSGTIVNKGVNTSLLPAGIYFLNINNTTTKFIKE